MSNKNKNIVELVMSTKKEKTSPRTRREGTATKVNAKIVRRKGTTRKPKKLLSVGRRKTKKEGSTTGGSIFIPCSTSHISGMRGWNEPPTFYPNNSVYIAELGKRFASITSGPYDTQMKEQFLGTWFRRAIDAISKSIRKKLNWFFQRKPSVEFKNI